MIEIDGSYGEGGGQILRTALGLSCLYRKQFRIVNIRKGRKRPGLAPQHLGSVRAAKEISGADVVGDREGSLELVFSPGEVKGGDFSLEVGTAGSALLVLQAVLPALSAAPRTSTLSVGGGTHVPFSPSWHYAACVLLPSLRAIGLGLSLSIESYGFYPRGGGRIRADVVPAEKVRPLRREERGRILRIRGWSAVGNLPMPIAVRQRDAAREALRVRLPAGSPQAEIEILSVPTPGQGTFLFLSAEAEHAVAGFTSLGARGKRAEEVGEEAAAALAAHVATGAALDPHLADQIAVCLASCGEGSVFTTSRITSHLVTNLWTISRFRDVPCRVDGGIGEPGTVRIGGTGNAGPDASPGRA